MDWFSGHDWQVWLVAALLLAGAELTTTDFTLLMLAVGAGIACILAAIGIPVVGQVIVFAIASVALLAFVRPSFVRRMHAGPTLKTGTQSLIGKDGLVLERVTAYSGRIKLSGEVWSARTYDETVVVEPGQKVEVAEIDGATAVIYPIP